MSFLFCPLMGSRIAARRHAVGIAFALFCCAPFAVMANAEAPEQKNVWGLGVGVASTQKAYKSIDRDTTPVPLLHLDNPYFRFFGTGIEAKLPELALSETQRLNFGLIGRYEGSGYKAGDSPALAGMAERKGGLWAGVKVEWQTAFANVRADWTHDVSGNSKGQQVKLEANQSWLIGNDFTLTPRIGMAWRDGKYTDYYYGVRSDEVRIDRPAYRASSSLDVEIGVQGLYAFNKHHSIMLDMQAIRLSSEIANSPLTDRTTENRLFLGYAYYF
ncbi:MULTISPECIES: MipA/OmpV family protein [Serratia]|jgi:outer membrane protein|uniref:MipA/OmpV family protein n=1 Tax=Serratia TaxID=613 RepID=UPI001F5DAEFB|nr:MULTISPECIES: MipA/OmpV family protein [Serratia]CAI1637541.1 MltA-interacting protein precursor [Serratia ficaria]CAI2151266.1 MltA-interacting protein precursor [Serratia ficaria]CAI2483804.1 MltA-interacting protein precursor [Serratia ficaria]